MRRSTPSGRRGSGSWSWRVRAASSPSDGRLAGLVCLRTAYGSDRDASGRKVPHDVPGSAFEIPPGRSSWRWDRTWTTACSARTRPRARRPAGSRPTRRPWRHRSPACTPRATRPGTGRRRSSGPPPTASAPRPRSRHPSASGSRAARMRRPSGSTSRRCPRSRSAGPAARTGSRSGRPRSTSAGGSRRPSSATRPRRRGARRRAASTATGCAACAWASARTSR